MNINILRYSLFGIAGGQEVDRNFSSIYLPSYNYCIIKINNSLLQLVTLKTHYCPPLAETYIVVSHGSVPNDRLSFFKWKYVYKIFYPLYLYMCIKGIIYPWYDVKLHPLLH